MDIRLYQYSDLPNVANKGSTLTPLFSSLDVPGFTVYGTFDPLSATFMLSEYYPANYASYVYGNVTYYGSCYVTTTTRGEYEYRVTVDPVTTVWYHSALNTTQFVDYGPIAGGEEIDPRLPRSENLTVRRLEYGPILKNEDFDVWLIVANPNAQNFASQPYKLTPGAYRVYLFQRHDGINGVQHYRRFLRNLFRTAKTVGIFTNLDNYLASMIKAYVVPHALCGDTSGIEYDAVELFSLSGELTSNDNTLRIPSEPSHTWWTDENEPYVAFDVPLQNSRALSPMSVQFTIGGYTSGVQREGTWSLVLPFIGEIQFTPSQCFPSTALTLHAEISFNPIGGFYTVQMGYDLIGGGYTPFQNGLYTFPVQESTIVLAPGASTFSTESALTNFVGLSVSLATKNMNGAVTSAGGLLNDATSLFSSHSGSCHGTTDGSPYRSSVAQDTRVTLYVTYHDYMTPSFHDFWGKYGAQVSDMMVLSPKTSAGYIQTHDAKFPCGFLPPDIVRQAEVAFNSGVYLRKEG